MHLDMMTLFHDEMLGKQICSNLRRDVAQALRLPLQRVSVETALEVGMLKFCKPRDRDTYRPLIVKLGPKQEDLMGRLLYDETLPDLVVTLWYMPSEGAANQPSNLRDEFLRQVFQMNEG